MNYSKVRKNSSNKYSLNKESAKASNLEVEKTKEKEGDVYDINADNYFAAMGGSKNKRPSRRNVTPVFYGTNRRSQANKVQKPGKFYFMLLFI